MDGYFGLNGCGYKRVWPSCALSKEYLDGMRQVVVDSMRAFRHHWQIWRLLGMHPADPQTLWGRHYKVYATVWLITFRLVMWLSVMVNFLLSTSLESFCESLSVAVPLTVENLKAFSLRRTRQQILDTHDILQHLDGRIASLTESKIILDAIKRAHYVFICIYRAIVFVLGFGILFLFVSNERLMMFPSWIPWNYKESSLTVYLVTVTLHSLGFIENAMMVGHVDTCPTSYLIMLAGHTQALAHRVSRLGYDRRLTRAEACDRLRDCINDHQLILNIFQSLEHSLSISCFLQFFSTAIGQCAIFFFLIFVRIGIMQSVNMIFLLMIFTTETLLLCYSAELVCHEGEHLMRAIYDCNWLDQSLEFRRMIVLMLARTQKPMIMRAGLIVPVQMITFRMVCKVAYTMFTLLNEMQSSEVE
ncbi:putative odorant receptor 19b [Drosophila obscura]|uniref:putative odorant receptor 19b n=1 Tax=Drosophila obscura TaxID=7282 RepID=UPI001BB21996|nr:putative odorant receptor 19b [Drosophila obscura]